jgi:hypothetical protein
MGKQRQERRARFSAGAIFSLCLRWGGLSWKPLIQAALFDESIELRSAHVPFLAQMDESKASPLEHSHSTLLVNRTLYVRATPIIRLETLSAVRP